MKYSIAVTIKVTADQAPLVALYNATGGANWTNDTNWLSNEALSEWHRFETDRKLPLKRHHRIVELSGRNRRF